MLDIFIWIIAIIVHEAGHYAYYRLGAGVTPTFKFNGLTLEIGGNVIYKMKVLDVFFCAVAGIIAGMVPIFLLNGSLYVWIAYAVGCSQDITIFNSLLSIKDEKMTYLDFYEKELNEIKERYNNAVV